MFFQSSSVFQSRVFQNSLSQKGKPAKKKKVLATLMLTSLIDAFSILVVYLLMFFSDTGEMAYLSSDIDLPKANVIERLDRRSIVQIKKDGYFVEDRKLSAKELVPYLIRLKKRLSRSSSDEGEAITVQADKSVRYKQLSKVVQALGHVGFSHIQFAVLSE